MSDVPKLQADWAKAQVEELSKEAYQGLALTIRKEADRLKAYTKDGSIFGFISRDSEKIAAEGGIRLNFSIAKDGNIRAVWKKIAAG
jgi:hypothetical protein